MKQVCLLIAVVLLCGTQCTGLQQPLPLSRRDALAVGLAGVMLTPAIAVAASDNVVLTEEEMAARIARKLELQRKASRGEPLTASTPSSAYTADIRSDVNPEAGVDLRSRSFVENTKIAIAKQEEMSKRDKQQKRDDLCEMLGRGC